MMDAIVSRWRNNEGADGSEKAWIIKWVDTRARDIRRHVCVNVLIDGRKKRGVVRTKEGRTRT